MAKTRKTGADGKTRQKKAGNKEKIHPRQKTVEREEDKRRKSRKQGIPRAALTASEGESRSEGVQSAMSAKRANLLVELQKRASRILEGCMPEEGDSDLARLIHELEVHQVELEHSRNEYYALFDSAPVGFVIIGPKGVITRTNRMAEEMLGRPAGTLTGTSFHNLIYPDDLFRYSPLLKSLARRHRGTAELQLRGSHGPIDVRIDAVSCMDESGGFSSWHFALSDITGRKRAEDALKESEASLHAIFQSVEDAIITVDMDLRIVQANPSAGFMTGLSHRQLIGRPLSEFVDPGFDLPSAEQDFLKSGRFHGQAQIRHAGGSLRLVEASGIANIIPGRHLFVGHDITERKRMEDELLRSHENLELRVKERTADLEKEIEKREKFEQILRESGTKLAHEYQQRKRMSQKLVELLEKDRKEIAMNLHDDLGSALATAKMEIESMESEGAKSSRMEGDRVTRVKETLTEVMARIRTISSHLRPAALDRLGLVLSLRSLTEEVVRQAELRIHLHTQNLPERFTPEKELALYRIAQECLTNVIKHAEAREVFLSLSCRDGRIHFSLEDDGKGFDCHQLEENGFGERQLGISIMKERVSQFGGGLIIDSNPGRGTQVIAQIPIDEALDKPKP